MSEVKEIKTEKEFWKFIRKKRRGGKQEILLKDMDICQKYFCKLLEGDKEKGLDGVNRENETEENEKDKEVHQIEEKEMEKIEVEDFSTKEMKAAIKKLKKNSSPGSDGIENEAWIYAKSKEIEELRIIMNDIKNGKEISKEWIQSAIKPIYKKGNKEEPKNYRGIVLLSTAFKIMTSTINDRLVKEIEGRELIGEWQKGFRKGKGTIDKITFTA